MGAMAEEMREWLDECREMIRARKANELQIRERLAESLALLRRLEWAPEDDEYSGKNVCGICGNVEEEGHKPSCELAKLLSENEGGK